MKDKLGLEINIGDIVATSLNNKVVKGKVTGIDSGVLEILVNKNHCVNVLKRTSNSVMSKFLNNKYLLNFTLLK